MGLLAGTLGVAHYRQGSDVNLLPQYPARFTFGGQTRAFSPFPRDVLHRLKQLMRLSEKKYHTFLMGKINPAKLSNFTEVDIYTIVACPETSLVGWSYTKRINAAWFFVG